MEIFVERVVLFGILATVTSVIALFIAAFIMAPDLCAARWDSRKTEWSWLTGCRVEVDGQFIPEKNFRMIDGVP